MSTRAIPTLTGAVEGDIDSAVLRRLADTVGLLSPIIHVKSGKTDLRNCIVGYNSAAQHERWCVLVDLDHEAECAPNLRESWLPSPSPLMCFRVVVREIEAWILSDRERIAEFLYIPVNKVPQYPEQVDDPKQTLVNLARRSRKRSIREDIVPRPGSGRELGPAYNTSLIRFVSNLSSGWRPGIAANRSDSLRRCLERLSELANA